MAIFSYATGTPILKYNRGKIASPVTIDSTTVTAGSDGRKVVPAGSIIGTASVTAGQTILSDHTKGKVVNDATAEGLLLYDVDVTDGDATGALLTHGVVYSNALPVAPVTAAAAALKFISMEK